MSETGGHNLQMTILPPEESRARTETPGAVAISDGTMPCPVPSPSGLPCEKHIPKGWTASEGHGGGHFWMSAKTSAALDRGHYDATAALAGEPFTIHQPEDCAPECLYYGKPPGWPLPHARAREDTP